MAESAIFPAIKCETLTFNIGPDHAGTRLDAYLASQIEGWSRARLQRLIENEDVLVNGKARSLLTNFANTTRSKSN
jgi:23S rRNA-/tRNA-specific pseudouridylate synthase